MTPLKVDKKLSNNFLTLDIETMNVKNKLVPYCISWFNGNFSRSFYLTDFKTPAAMMKCCLRSIFIRLYNGHIIYVHNLSNFDGIFLLKVLASFEDCIITPQLRKGKMINIKVNYNGGQNSVNFRDSLLILPSSLKKLAKSFGVEDKGIFPYSFVNNNNLNYVGPVPEYKYFSGISLETYNNYKTLFKDNWSMKTETVKYCEQDCFVLFHIIDRFNSLIFELYNLNVHRFPSLPSLAFGIYRSKYLKGFQSSINFWFNVSWFKKELYWRGCRCL